MKNYDSKTVEKCGCEVYRSLKPKRFHRLDGPAICDTKGCCQGDSFWIEGIGLSEKDYWQDPEVIKYNNLQKLKKELGI